jgi:hypothetical protein
MECWGIALYHSGSIGLPLFHSLISILLPQNASLYFINTTTPPLPALVLFHTTGLALLSYLLIATTSSYVSPQPQAYCFRFKKILLAASRRSNLNFREVLHGLLLHWKLRALHWLVRFSATSFVYFSGTWCRISHIPFTLVPISSDIIWLRHCITLLSLTECWMLVHRGLHHLLPSRYRRQAFLLRNSTDGHATPPPNFFHARPQGSRHGSPPLPGLSL